MNTPTVNVASNNRFAQLAEDQPTPTRDSQADAPPKAPEAKHANSNATGRSAGRGRSRGRVGDRFPKNVGAKQPTEQTPTDDREPNAETTRVSSGNHSRGGRRDRGRGRGRVEGRGDDFGKHGGFDRHSGMGKRDTEKTMQQGWGGQEGMTEWAAEEGARTDAAKDGAVEDVNAWAEGVGNAGDAWGIPTEQAEEPAQTQEVTPVPAESTRPGDEEDDNTLTLEQYLATKKGVSVVPQLQPRLPNDGKDNFPEGDILSKDNNEEEYFSAQRKSANKAKRATEKKQRQVLDISFETPNRGGRGGRPSEDRGSRGRTRGGRGRGRSSAPPNGAPHTPDVDDQSAFPSLS